MRWRQQTHGFTLVEMVMAIVLLGIISAVLAPIITSSVTAYSGTHSRNELIARGRLALERLSREIHRAVPNSLRLVAGRTDTIEFVTASAGGRYVDRDDTQISAGTCPTANRFRIGFNLNNLCLLNPAASAPFASNDILVIGNTSPSSLQNGISSATINNVTGPAPVWTVSFTIAKSFNEASPGKHYSIADFTHEVGLTGGGLYWQLGAGVAAAYNDARDVASTDALLVDGVSAVIFHYDAAADGMLNIELGLAEGNETVQFYEEIYVRNTP